MVNHDPIKHLERTALWLGAACIVLFALCLIIPPRPLMGMELSRNDELGFKDWLPAPTLSPEQIELYRRCPELRSNPNQICASEMLSTASSIFNAAWLPLSIFVITLVSLGLIIGFLTREEKPAPDALAKPPAVEQVEDPYTFEI